MNNKIAQKRGVPAFVIFSDSALRDMCVKMPTTDEEFLTVNGVGETKLKQYGKLFTDRILAYKNPALYAEKHKTAEYKKSKTVNHYTIPFDRWTAEETADLIAEYNGGRSIRDIAWGHNRTPKAIRFALDRLRDKGLIY